MLNPVCHRNFGDLTIPSVLDLLFPELLEGRNISEKKYDEAGYAEPDSKPPELLPTSQTFDWYTGQKPENWAVSETASCVRLGIMQ